MIGIESSPNLTGEGTYLQRSDPDVDRQFIVLKPFLIGTGPSPPPNGMIRDHERESGQALDPDTVTFGHLLPIATRSFIQNVPCTPLELSYTFYDPVAGSVWI